MMAQGARGPHLIGPQSLLRLLRVARACCSHELLFARVVVLLQLQLLLLLLRMYVRHATTATPSGPGIREQTLR